MNSALYGKTYRVPQNIIERIRAKLYSTNETGGNGVKRGKFIVNNAQCTYQMLKRLKNFFDHFDPATQLEEYELAGGKNMQDFVERTLNSERNLVTTRKKSNVMFMPQLDNRSLTAGSGRHDLSINENFELLQKNALAVIFDRGNGEQKVLCLKRSDGDHWEPRKWALVGGKVEEGEGAYDAIVREIKEETGLLIDEFIGYFVIKTGKEHVEYVYVAIIEGQPAVTLNDEHTDYGWFATEELKDLDRVDHLDDMVALAKQKVIIYTVDNDDTLKFQ
jgi:dihydroneopterin triphosphate diphosphatase